MGARLHFAHLDMLRRVAELGRAWAHDALKPTAHLLYVSASGFTDGFHAAVAEDERDVLAWDLSNLYVEARDPTDDGAPS